MRVAPVLILIAIVGLIIFIVSNDGGGEPQSVPLSILIIPSANDSRGGVDTKPEGKREVLFGGATAESPIPSQGGRPKISYGQIVGQVLRADGVPATGGELRFVNDRTGEVSTYLVDVTGIYSTGPIPMGEEVSTVATTRVELNGMSALVQSQNSKPLLAGLYTPLFRNDRDSAWQVLPDVYSGNQQIEVLENMVLPQDFVLRKGVRVVGVMRVDLPSVPNASGDIELVSVDSGTSVGKAHLGSVTPNARRLPRFEGDLNVPRSGEFLFDDIPPGDYLLRLYGVGRGIPPNMVRLHAARAVHVEQEDVFLDDMLISIDEFLEEDPPRIIPAPILVLDSGS